ncbi:dnaJ homolog subfamily C member 25 homolog [Tubulanus polymorphus]|uniref:dnaJ homolog subfamily C member 25 homolog n=1 Tax=Tubulanus polymorphus TaxID=672921 RepID=UPI003DA40ACF
MATSTTLTCLLLVNIFVFSPVSGLLEGMYCGKDNCYDLLGMTRDNTKTEITKAYRKLARKWHPDRHRDPVMKEEASVMFQNIARAYEILKDEGARSEYDYMLDNPEEMWMNYYYYYRRRMAPQVDVRIVLVVTISIVSVIQYYGAWSNYHTAISYLATVPKYRIRALDIAKTEKLLDDIRNKKLNRKMTKDEIKEKEETVIKNIIVEKMDIRGGYSKPSVLNTLWLQLACSPYYLGVYIWWWLRWIFKYWILKEEYGDAEKEYIIRRNMGLSQTQWEALEDYDKTYYMKRELWIKEHFQEWKEEREAEMKVKMAENAKYKSYRRYMKSGGPGQLSFGPD